MLCCATTLLSDTPSLEFPKFLMFRSCFLGDSVDCKFISIFSYSISKSNLRGLVGNIPETSIGPMSIRRFGMIQMQI